MNDRDSAEAEALRSKRPALSQTRISATRMQQILSREERRAMIEAAPVEFVERDGRIWQLRRLPSAVTE
jgi:hypothetical protein